MFKSIFSAALCSIALLLVLPLEAQVNDNHFKRDVLKVNGQGVVSNVPDVISFSLNLSERGEKASKLHKLVRSQAEKLVARLVKLGIDKRDIQSLEVQLQPWMENVDRKQRQRGFIMNQQFDIKVRDFKRYAGILDAVMESGAQQVYGFRYEYTGAEGAYLKAMDLAIDNAKMRAERMAKRLGVKLGVVAKVTELGGYQSVPEMAAVSYRSSDAYQPGTTSTRADVEVVFVISQY